MAKVPEGLRGDLHAAVAVQNSLFGAKKSLIAANEQLHPDEVVLAATTTLMERGPTNHNGVLIVTDRRLLFIHARGFAQAAEEIRYDTITGIADRKGLTAAHLTVTAAGGISTKFRNIPNKQHPLILDAVRTHLSR